MASRCRLLLRSEERRGSEEHTSELQSPWQLVCRLLLEKTAETCTTQTGRGRCPRERPWPRPWQPGCRAARTLRAAASRPVFSFVAFVFFFLKTGPPRSSPFFPPRTLSD